MDPRVKKLAEVLVHYSLEIKAGQQVAISGSPLAEELALAAYAEALKTGAHVTLWYEAPEQWETFFKLATDAQLDYISPVQKLVKDILFDEKLGGTIHLAVGAGFPETGGRNKSGLHWDLLCDMKDAQITVDGQVFYRDRQPVLWGMKD